MKKPINFHAVSATAFVLLFLLGCHTGESFVVPSSSRPVAAATGRRSSGMTTAAVTGLLQLDAATAAAASSLLESPDARNFVLSGDEIHPILSFGKGSKTKVMNLFGAWSIFAALITGPIWMAAMKIVHLLGRKRDKNRAMFDKTGKIWCKTWLKMTNSFPTITGDTDWLKSDSNRACLFVANHASWVDIPVLCTVLDPVFKFIAKKELEKIPCIGNQLKGGEHIIIDRDDRRSQLKTFKDGVKWLKKGVPLMAFPEGRRSKDGRLMKMKGGLFLMAVKTKVPIVPITISHAHAVMPGDAIGMVQPGKGKLRVHVHEPISAEGKSDDELTELVRESFLETLPLAQLPLEEERSDAVPTTAGMPTV